MISWTYNLQTWPNKIILLLQSGTIWVIWRLHSCMYALRRAVDHQYQYVPMLPTRLHVIFTRDLFVWRILISHFTLYIFLNNQYALLWSSVRLLQIEIITRKKKTNLHIRVVSYKSICIITIILRWT